MPEPLAELAYTQIGVEATPGTATPANRKITSWGVTLSPETTFDEFTAQGYSDPTIVALSREETAGPLDGRGSYTDIVYLLSSILTTATVIQPDAVASPTVYLWEFLQNPTGLSTPKALTVERDNTAATERSAGMRLRELNLDFGGENLSLSGSFVGKPIETGIAMTANPTVIAAVPVMRKHISVYIDAPGATLAAWDTTFGTTKLTRARVGSVSIGDRFTTWYGHDAAAGTGPIVTVERRGTKNIEVTMFRDAVAQALLANTRNGDIRQMRIQAVGGVIEDAFTYQLTIDLAVQAVSGFGTDEDEGAEVTTVGFRPIYSTVWTRATRFRVQNTLATL